MLVTKTRLKRIFSAICLCLLLVLSYLVPSIAACNPNAQSCSSQWQVTETFFGSGGELNACSTSYCSKQSAGELTVGKICSTNEYCAQSGFNTFRQPFLEVNINTPSVNVGVLESDTPHTGTAQFQVKSYLAHGYSVTTMSDPPTSGSDTMAAPSTPTASAVGTEQFGINLVANTSPTNFGADPSQDPSASFSFGEAATNYDQADQFMYNKGDTIAESSSSSGFTLYTISYLFNISKVTPAGTYTMQHNLVVTSTF